MATRASAASAPRGALPRAVRAEEAEFAGCAWSGGERRAGSTGAAAAIRRESASGRPLKRNAHAVCTTAFPTTSGRSG